MELARVFAYLRPEAQFSGRSSYSSLATIAETYIGSDLPTQEEINAVDEADVIAYELDVNAQRAIDNTKLNKLLFSINFDQENRLRILEEKPEISKAQYRDALIAEYKEQ